MAAVRHVEFSKFVIRVSACHSASPLQISH